MRTLILGLGNDLRGDDGVGLRVIEDLRSRFSFPGSVDLHSTGASGVHVMHFLFQYERLYIVDACEVDSKHVGRFWVRTLSDLPENTRGFQSSHSISVKTLLTWGTAMGFKDPKDVLFFLIGIERISNPYHLTVCDHLSDRVRSVVPLVSKKIVRDLH